MCRCVVCEECVCICVCGVVCVWYVWCLYVCVRCVCVVCACVYIPVCVSYFFFINLPKFKIIFGVWVVVFGVFMGGVGCFGVMGGERGERRKERM